MKAECIIKDKKKKKIKKVKKVKFANSVNLDKVTHLVFYHIFSVIRKSFFIPKNPKNLDPSYKMDIDLWDCLGRVKSHIIAKFYRTDLVICSLSSEERPRLIAE